MSRVGSIAPYDLGSPVTLVEERLVETETGAGPAVVKRREFTADDMVTVMALTFGFPLPG